ncbi:MAG: protein-tyrosine kinase [Gammaproteobacteria bacterium]|jgi:protein-tyrosine kinase
MKDFNKAVERARKLREPGSPNEDSDLEFEGEELAAETPSLVDQIHYSQTRTIVPGADALAANCVVANSLNAGASAAYDMLRTQVLQKLDENGWNSIAVVSPSAAEGKTLTGVNLAISIARNVTHTVLLVDLDLRHPNVHTTLGCKPEYGIGDYLINDIPLHKILFTTGIPRLVVLPGREALENSAELLSSPKMVRLTEELKQRYASRIVIFDLPPLLATDDAIAFSPYVDAVLMVIKEGVTRIADVRRASGYLKKTPILGTALNHSIHKLE